jgi:hypothetical protein
VVAPGPPRQPAPGTAPAHPLVRLVTRLVIAQAVAAAAVGLLFSRRHVAAILFTLGLVAALCLLAIIARSGSRAAWLAVLGFESALFIGGLARFIVARYVGGTLFALVIAGTVLHPAVARAFTVGRGRGVGHARGAEGLGETGETIGEQAAG